jgi:triacylglycerol esterase/lipase EstA (alpha/beta hydrolase family)
MGTGAPDELRALSALAFGELRHGVGGIASLHGAIADRAFRGAGPARATHDAIAGGVYAAVGAGAVAGRLAADGALALRGPGGRAVSRTPRGAGLIAVLTGLRGDALAREASALHEPMSVRVDGRPVAVERAALAAAFPSASERVVVFAHGLFESEHAWGGVFADALARELGWTPVALRYNSGLHISENGRELDALLAALVGAWPVPMARIALVGHSMGGLVARSAAHHGARAESGWTPLVSDVVSLGTPHLGAPLAQAIHVASAALAEVPETRPLAGLLRRRSSGIRDLRRGSLVDADWAGHDPDALRAAARSEVPLLPGATHTFVSATVTRRAGHPVGRLVGDGLVLSASAEARRLGFDVDLLQVGAAHHLALLRHPAVLALLRQRLA